MSYNIDVKFIQSFKPEEYTEFENIFKSFDKDKSGFIEKKELITLFHNLGYRTITEEDIKKFLAGIDLNSDGKISFEEFLKLMKKFTEDDSKTFTKFITKSGRSFIRTNTKDNNMSYQTFPEEERAAYVKVINAALFDDPVCKKYLPIDPDTNEVFTRLKNGILLCKLINKAQPGTIDERVINLKDNMNVFLQVENLNLAISAAKSIGCQIIAIYPDSFRRKKYYYFRFIMASC